MPNCCVLTLALIRSGHAAEWLYYYELHIYKNISNFTFKLKNLASSVCWKYHLSQNFIFSPLGNFLRMRNSPIYYMWELGFFRSFSTLNFSHASQFRKWQMYHLSGVIYCTKLGRRLRKWASRLFNPSTFSFRPITHIFRSKVILVIRKCNFFIKVGDCISARIYCWLQKKILSTKKGSD